MSVFQKKSVVTNLVLPHFLLLKKVRIAEIIVIEKKSVVTNLVLLHVWFSKKVRSDKLSITLCLVFKKSQ